ncbi:MAG: AAA family ATPase [Planctomycetota bacterium]
MPGGSHCDQLLEQLRDPGCFPGEATSVEVLQTHLSIVCLAGGFAYKLKKSVVLPFVDFSTLAARQRACRDEVLLNRRLCPDVYLGTAPLRPHGEGVRFADVGDPEGQDDVDMAVVMRRLPQERMLDVLLRSRKVHATEISSLARAVAAFHATANRDPEVTGYGSPERLAELAASNFDELRGIRGHGLPVGLMAALAERSRTSFGAILPELKERAAEGHVVDGHGDLHARNVCMTDPPTIYDCIEFEPSFRCGDVATEIAFLAMDLRYRSHVRLARIFVDTYVSEGGDERCPALLPILCSYRALIRCKVAAIAATEEELPLKERDAARASAYDHALLACAHAIEMRDRPCWLLVCGPPASGKTELCRELARRTHWTHLCTDIVRKQLAGIGPTRAAGPECYTAVFTRATYGALLRYAAKATEEGERVVVLDGNFSTQEQRKQARGAASAVGARVFVVNIEIDLETAVERARRRQGEENNVSDADEDIVAARLAQFHAPRPEEGQPLMRLPGTTPIVELMHEVLIGMLKDDA